MLKLSAASSLHVPAARRTQRFRVRIKTGPPRFTRSPGVVHRAAQRKRGEPPSSFFFFKFSPLKTFLLLFSNPLEVFFLFFLFVSPQHTDAFGICTPRATSTFIRHVRETRSRPVEEAAGGSGGGCRRGSRTRTR